MSGEAEVFRQIMNKYDEAAGGNAGLGVLKSDGNPVHPSQLSSMMSALSLIASLIV